MTLERMVQVMKTYHENNTLTIEQREIGYDSWKVILNPEWDWSSYEYRIKNTKFLPQDKVIFKGLESTPITEQQILEVRGYTCTGKLELTDGNKTIDVNEETLINVNDCLWYWEYYSLSFKEFRIANKRSTREFIEKEYKPCKTKPLYQLGFKLPN